MRIQSGESERLDGGCTDIEFYSDFRSKSGVAGAEEDSKKNYEEEKEEKKEDEKEDKELGGGG